MEYIQITNDDPLPELQHLKPYRCIVVIEEEISESRRLEISDWLVESGCLYMMAWGKEGGLWDDSVDMSNLKKFNFGEVPANCEVMTTWHDDEPLSDVFWFSKNSAHHEVESLKNTVLLHLSNINKQQEFIDEYNNV